MENTVKLSDSVQKVTLSGNEIILALDGRNISIPLSVLKEFLGVKAVSGIGGVVPNEAYIPGQGSAEAPAIYFAAPGIYSGFGGIELISPLSVISWDGSAAQTMGVPIDLDYSITVQKSELFSKGLLLDISQYIQVDKRINSSGVLGTYAGAKVAYMVPFTGYNLNISGWKDDAARNFSFYNEAGQPINPQTVNNSYPASETILSSDLVRFFSVNLQTVSTQPDPTDTLVFSGNVSINSITDIPIAASGLTENNLVPDPVSPTGGVNRLFLELNTFNKKNSEVTGSSNIGFQSDIKDRGYYIGINGRATAGGWETWERRSHGGSKITIHNFSISEGGYYAFRKDDGTYFYNSSIFVNDEQSGKVELHIEYPLTEEFSTLVLDVSRPADVAEGPLNRVQFTANEGDVALPYEEAIPRTITNIGGYGINPIGGTPLPDQPYRKPMFSFVFDDGTSGDTDVVALFDTYGYKCAFALITNYQGIPLSQPDIDRYLTYQSNGHKVFSHGVTHRALFNLNQEEAEMELRDSLEFLANAGFNVKGFVAPNSIVPDEFIPLVKKYYQYAFTRYFGQATPMNLKGYQGYYHDLRKLHRVSLESSDTTSILLQIDETIEKNGYCCFYGHRYPGEKMTVEKMEAVLNYLVDKESQGLCDVVTPEHAFEVYYRLDHEAIVNIVSNGS